MKYHTKPSLKFGLDQIVKHYFPGCCFRINLINLTYNVSD